MKEKINSLVENICKSTDEKGFLKDRNNNLYLDLDDIAPFLLAMGKKDFVKKQIELSIKQTKNGFIAINGYLCSWRMDEYLGAITNFLETNKDPLIKKHFEAQEAALNKILDQGFLPGVIDAKNLKGSKITYSRGFNLIEAIIETKLISKELKKKAFNILSEFIANEYFQKNSVFLNKYVINNKKYIGKLSKINFLGDSSLRPNKNLLNKLARKIQYLPFSRSQIMKDNTSVVFCVMEAYKQSKNPKYAKAARKWIDGVIKQYYTEGAVRKSNTDKTISLAQNFAFLDVLLDYYKHVKADKEVLQYAEKIANYWLDKKSSNGQIPEVPGVDYYFLDTQTDFSICLKKLSILTNNKKYLIEGKALFDITYDNFIHDGLLVTGIDSKNNVKNSHKSIKYNALYLKGYLAHYTDSKVFGSLFKDR